MTLRKLPSVLFSVDPTDMVKTHKRALDLLYRGDYTIHSKPATEGCEEAAEWRWDVTKGKFGVELAVEMKTLLMLAEETDIPGQQAILAFHLPADTKLPPDRMFRTEFLEIPEFSERPELGIVRQPTRFGKLNREAALEVMELEPGTINPISVLAKTMEKAATGFGRKTIHIFDQSLYDRKGPFATNAGTRTASMVVDDCQRFIRGIEKRLDRTVAVADAADAVTLFHDAITGELSPMPSVFVANITKQALAHGGEDSFLVSLRENVERKLGDRSQWAGNGVLMPDGNGNMTAQRPRGR